MGYRIDLGDGLAAMSKYPEKVFDLVYAGLWNNVSQGEMATMGLGGLLRLQKGGT